LSVGGTLLSTLEESEKNQNSRNPHAIISNHWNSSASDAGER